MLAAVSAITGLDNVEAGAFDSIRQGYEDFPSVVSAEADADSFTWELIETFEDGAVTARSESLAC
ncbi:hypothetical protein BVC93_01820 [Mycobacterium sp. MS1601]|nr:hypothetical protein BVC93_01820 [Mycobacterium sp. MS1601]